MKPPSAIRMSSSVMCHFGDPWLMDAAAVVEKNENVAADLSGLLEGKFDIPEFLEEQSGYISTLKTWLAYIRDYDKLMFGTDWPLANYEDYIEITKRLIPEKYWETVFYQAAERIYHCNF
ncbi:MAG: amidohydrolase family protein [Clostridium fessum]